MRLLLVRMYSLVNILYITLKQKVKIDYSCNVRKSSFEGNNKVLRKSILYNCNVGYGTYIGANCNINNTQIGRFCSIASGLNVIYGNHPTKNFVSTHPAFYSNLGQAGFTYSDKSYFEEFKYINRSEGIMVEIGHDCWIGANVTIVDGVKIGNGVIVGANSFVNKDLEDYTIYAGIPAKKIKKRFSEEEIDFLLNFKWWEKDESWIKEHYKDFHSVIEFRKKYEE